MAPVEARSRCFPVCSRGRRSTVSAAVAEPVAKPSPPLVPRALPRGVLLGRHRQLFPNDRFFKKFPRNWSNPNDEHNSEEDSVDLSLDDVEPIARRPPSGRLRMEFLSRSQAAPPSAETKLPGLVETPSDGPPEASEELRAALGSFREDAEEALSSLAAPGGQNLPQLRAQLQSACELVGSVLSGLQSHLPGKIAEMRRCPSCVHGGLGELRVRIADGPAVGDFATRSRQPVQLRLFQELSFALECPEESTDPRRGRAVVLRVSGVELEALPEILELRNRLRRELGATPEGFTVKSVGSWWLNNRDPEFPVGSSKLRRLCDSFEEVASLPLIFQAKAFWGYLHAVSLTFDAFEFWTEAGSVTVTAKTHLSNPADAQAATVGSGMCHEMLQAHRPLAERFAASTVNMAALFHAQALQYRGANPAKVAKLFSAAKRWGPGPTGWHKLDETWLCVDSRDFFGRITEEQGRVLWRGAVA